MIFRQMFEPLSCTYTYLVACEKTGQALLIDPVIVTIDRDVALLKALDLQLVYSVDTHIHADHITSARELKKRVGCKIAMPDLDQLTCTDIGLKEGVPLSLGDLQLHALHTPGHTQNHFAYVVNHMVFTGDSLLIEGCGRTDFQNGSAAHLYASVHQKLFALPDETLVYPGHDYQNRFVSSIAQEKKRNPRLGGNKTLEEFIALMENLNLPYPKFIEYAVVGNQQCGVCPTSLPGDLERYCGNVMQSVQG
jgi:sulfur dioxygenase